MKTLLVVAGFSLVAVANADIFVDDFSSGAISVTLTGTQQQTDVEFGTMLGGSRTSTFFTDTGNPFNLPATWNIDQNDANGNPMPGLFVDAGASEYADTSLNYSGFGALSPANFAFDFLASDQSITCDVEVTSDAQAGFVSGEISTPAQNSPFTVIVSSFNGPIDYAHISNILIQLPAQPGADFALQDIRLVAAPEPGPIAMLGLAIFGIAQRRNRRTRRQGRVL